MRNYVQLDLAEYDRLKEVQVEATTIVEQTNVNLKKKLDIANARITELEAENRKYAIGGARERPDSTVDFTMPTGGIEVYDTASAVTNLDEVPLQTRGSAKLGRRRWGNLEIFNMETGARANKSLTHMAITLNRTVLSIKTQAARMNLSSSNGILSER